MQLVGLLRPALRLQSRGSTGSVGYMSIQINKILNENISFQVSIILLAIEERLASLRQPDAAQLEFFGKEPLESTTTTLCPVVARPFLASP